MNSLHQTICQFPDRSLPLFRRGVPLFLRTFQFLRMLNLLEPCGCRIYDCYLCVLSSRKDFVRIAVFTLYLTLKLHKALKKRGLNPKNVECFADAIKTGAIKIPEIQKQYAKIKDDLEVIDYKKTMAKYQLDDMNNQITYLNRISYN